ncbi:matrilin-4 isoform X1 [Poecilia latipinna]|uniref:matrilin-4 isoform X1 n=1 Tax=Poecilia latipinna TaxID=48699 RepID=UPI00072DE976|nr:PREDICTED: matrilin-4 isoform X1 [Poecilia latipinna]XP_014876747.1 PREDICTED: matrilin-4 isoform X1 [Poecilia latipinna]
MGNLRGLSVFIVLTLAVFTSARPKSGPNQKCKSGPVDLVFLIDSSRSVRPHEFETMRKFLIDILNTLDIGLDTTRVGVVQYSSQVRSEFSLKTHSKLENMVKAINEIVPLAQGTMTGLAIRYLMNEAFSPGQGDRPKVPNVAVIVTDGRPQDRVAEVAAEARERGIEIYAVGVARADMTSLRAMASPPFEDHVFLVERFDLIYQFGLQFQDKLCGIDLCLESDHGCEHLCESSPGSFTCQCLPGYRLNADGKTCSAIDLCAERKHDCQQICISSPGSFTCDCNQGYHLNDDKKTCSPIDLCAEGKHDCQQVCVYMGPGVFTCDCNEGYRLNVDEKTCAPIDLCAEGKHDCEQVCVYSGPGIFTCDCNEGYRLNVDEKACSPIDLCAEEKHDCQQVCVYSGPGVFTCDCNKGYRLNGDKKTCTPIDLCAEEKDDCQQACVYMGPGVFSCDCNEGYRLNGDEKTCSPIDLCAEGKHGCEQVCVYMGPGVFTCDCNEGYRLNVDEKTCSPIDLCAEGKHGCEQVCVYSGPGIFTCDCNEGYRLNGDKKTCTPIDLCAEGKHDCDHVCVNMGPGIFTCDCKKGYRLNEDEKSCSAIDLCAEGKHDCEQICISTPGVFTCDCNKGFKLNRDKRTCTNMDMCNTVKHGCDYQCVNTPGSYHCICPEGQLLQDDGKTCGTCKSANIDLVLLIDGSKSVRPQNFELVKKFVNQVVDSLDVSAHGTRVGLVQYSSRVRTEFPLNMYHTAEDIKAAVMKVDYMEKGTMTGLALKHMLEYSFSEAEGARPASRNIPRIGLVFTDGRSQDDISEYAKKAKEAGITMYAVGVGKAVEDELREIASDPVEKHFYYTTDFSAINTIADNLKLNVCPAESQGEVEVKDPCACENLVEFQQATMNSLDQFTQKLASMAARLEQLENQLLSRK